MNLKPKFFALSLLLIFMLTSSPGYADKQPLMEIAMNNLVRAEKALKKAAWDKGGHRVKALHHVRKAMQEVKMGMRFSDEVKAKKKR